MSLVSVYHSIIGSVNIIPRPTLSVGLIYQGKLVKVKTSSGRLTGDIMCFKPVVETDWIVIKLGDNQLVKFAFQDLEYFIDGRYCIDLAKTELIDYLPEEVFAA